MRKLVPIPRKSRMECGKWSDSHVVREARMRAGWVRLRDSKGRRGGGEEGEESDGRGVETCHT